VTNQACPHCGAHHWTATIAYARGELRKGEPLRGITDAVRCGVCGHRYVATADGTLRDTDGDS
jgi:hypothetical protein